MKKRNFVVTLSLTVIITTFIIIFNKNNKLDISQEAYCFSNDEHDRAFFLLYGERKAFCKMFNGIAILQDYPVNNYNNQYYMSVENKYIYLYWPGTAMNEFDEYGGFSNIFPYYGYEIYINKEDKTNVLIVVKEVTGENGNVKLFVYVTGGNFEHAQKNYNEWMQRLDGRLNGTYLLEK